MSSVVRKRSCICEIERGRSVALPYRLISAFVFFSASVSFRFVFAKGLSKQFFSHAGTEPPLPGYYKYFLGGKCILLKDTTQRPRVRIEPPTSRSGVRRSTTRPPRLPSASVTLSP